MFKSYLPFLAVFVCIMLQSCAKDTDLISEYVILDAAKTEYKSVEAQKLMNTDAPVDDMQTAGLIPFTN